MKQAIFVFEIFWENILRQDESRDIFGEFFGPSVARVKKFGKNVEKIKKKNCLIKKISSQQASKQTYIGNFVYLFVTLNTFHLTL